MAETSALDAQVDPAADAGDITFLKVMPQQATSLAAWFIPKQPEDAFFAGDKRS